MEQATEQDGRASKHTPRCACCGQPRTSTIKVWCRRCSVAGCPTAQDETPRPCGYDPSDAPTTEQTQLVTDGGRATPQTETNREKGERNERQACRILSARYRAERIATEHDPFHLADLMGLQGGLPFLLVQVKTNRFSAEDRRYYRKWAHRKVDGEHTVMEVWVRKDRAGWEMYRLDPETREFTCYFETSTCDPSKVRDEWRAVFMEVTDVAQ